MIVIDAFALLPGVDETTFVAADARYQQEVAYQQPGLLRRTTARSDDGRWCVITHWASAAAADAALVSAAGDASATDAFTACIDPATRRSERFTPLVG